MDDPILLAATACALIFTPIISVLLSKVKLKYVFIVPVLFMVISFPMFLFLVIVQGIPTWSMLLFVVSMSMWTGGFFTLFFAIIYYILKKNSKSKSM